MSKAPRRTSATYDPIAKDLNKQLNIVGYRIECGHALRAVLVDKFGGDIEQFRRWAKVHLDLSEKSLARYLVISSHEQQLLVSGLISLTDCYEFLDLNHDQLFKLK